MIVLIADSGSSKTDWVVVSGSKKVRVCQTAGFNPYFQTKQQIKEELEKSLIPELAEWANKISRIYFYGSGCSSEKNCSLVQQALAESIGSNSHIEVSHDLLAAARALCGNTPGIAAILGTGSNSCLYDGKNILENVASAGYLWSDHGGGSQIGKYFIRDYFEGELPPDLSSKFEAAGYNRETILENVYKAPLPSKYLATVSKFMNLNIQHPHVKKVLIECFRSFFTQQIMKYSNSKSYKIGIVGSVGYVYREMISQVAADFGYQLGKVLKSPIEGLVDFHINQT
jgi:glucosamine kinase